METSKDIRLNGEVKFCNVCNREMSKIEFPKHFRVLKYCSPECREKVKQERIEANRSKKPFGNNEHNQYVLELNEIINGKIISPNTNKGKSPHYAPDILKDDDEFEVELIGHSRRHKLSKKWCRERIDGRTHKKRVLIVAIPKKLITLFDEVYFINCEQSKKEIRDKYNSNQ